MSDHLAGADIDRRLLRAFFPSGRGLGAIGETDSADLGEEHCLHEASRIIRISYLINWTA